VLTTVSQIDPIWFYLPISEQSYWEFADRLKEMMAVPEEKRKQNVELTLADGSVYPHKGRFAFLDRQVDPKTGTIQVAVSFPNPELTLRPGQYGIARAEIQTIPNALLIPQQAISQLQGSNMIAVVNPDGKAEIRAIKVGETYQGMIVVTEGLKAGETVIVGISESSARDAGFGKALYRGTEDRGSQERFGEETLLRRPVLSRAEILHVQIFYQSTHRCDGDFHRHGDRRHRRVPQSAGRAIS